MHEKCNGTCSNGSQAPLTPWVKQQCKRPLRAWGPRVQKTVSPSTSSAQIRIDLAHRATETEGRCTDLCGGCASESAKASFKPMPWKPFRDSRTNSFTNLRYVHRICQESFHFHLYDSVVPLTWRPEFVCVCAVDLVFWFLASDSPCLSSQILAVMAGRLLTKKVGTVTANSSLTRTTCIVWTSLVSDPPPQSSTTSLAQVP